MYLHLYMKKYFCIKKYFYVLPNYHKEVNYMVMIKRFYTLFACDLT